MSALGCGPNIYTHKKNMKHNFAFINQKYFTVQYAIISKIFSIVFI